MLIAAGSLLLGASALVTAGRATTKPARVLGGNVPVSAGATDPLDLRANNSPSLVRNPARPSELVEVNRVDLPRFGCALHVSGDGGATWTPRPLPPAPAPDATCYAPDAAFGADGTLYVVYVTLEGLGNVPSGVWLTTSRDGGRALSLPTRVLGRLAFQVRLTADPSVVRRLYLSWLQADGAATLAFPHTGNPILFARSDDGGRTWRNPTRLSATSRDRVVAPSPGVGPADELYVLYLDLGQDKLDYDGGHRGIGGPAYPGPWSLVLARSIDGGNSWSESVVDDGLVPTERFVVFTPPFPSLAVGRHERRVYAGFHDGRLGDADVWVWASADGGRSFSRRVRVNDTRRADGRSQYLPKLAVAPGGRLDVVYYDRRADPEDRRNEVSLQSSSDGARSFGPRVRLSDRSFDSGVGPGAERGMADLGSRLALVTTDRRALALWTDTRGGTTVTAKQDIVRAVATVSAARLSPTTRWALSAAGVVLLVLGLTVLTVALRDQDGQEATPLHSNGAARPRSRTMRPG